MKKWALTHRIVHKSSGSARSQFLGIVHDSVFYPQLHCFFTVSGGWPLILKGITISFYLTPFCWKHRNLKFSWTCLEWLPSCPSWTKFIKFKLYLIKSYFQFWNFDSPTYLPTSQHHALSAQAAWLVRILQTVRSWAATSASSIDHPNHLIMLEYWSFRCKNNWFELCMGNETI